MPRKTGRPGREAEAQESASMRPRPDAAENRQDALYAGHALRRFNEAAARCRGKPSAAYLLGQHDALLQ